MIEMGPCSRSPSHTDTKGNHGSREDLRDMNARGGMPTRCSWYQTWYLPCGSPVTSVSSQETRRESHQQQTQEPAGLASLGRHGKGPGCDGRSANGGAPSIPLGLDVPQEPITLLSPLAALIEESTFIHQSSLLLLR